MQIYFEPTAGYFLSLMPEVKSSLQLTDKTKDQIASKSLTRSIMMDKVSKDSKYREGTEVILEADATVMKNLVFDTSEGEKNFYLVHESNIVGTILKNPNPKIEVLN